MDPRDLPGGGPAFPPMHDPDTHASGMTLRDYFAAQAMQAHIVASFSALAAAYEKDTDRVNEILAMTAYETADAMIRQRG